MFPFAFFSVLCGSLGCAFSTGAGAGRWSWVVYGLVFVRRSSEVEQPGGIGGSFPVNLVDLCTGGFRMIFHRMEPV